MMREALESPPQTSKPSSLRPAAPAEAEHRLEIVELQGKIDEYQRRLADPEAAYAG